MKPNEYNTSIAIAKMAFNGQTEAMSTYKEHSSHKMAVDSVPYVSNKDHTELLGHMEIDNIWRKLGKFGKYQTTQTIFIWLCYPSVAWHTFSILFIGYAPDFVCNRPPNDTDQCGNAGGECVNTSYSECRITNVYSNGSQERACVFGYNYSIPRESSFVSEWDLVCNNEGLSGLTQTLFVFGEGFGSLAASVSDIFGRKPTYIISQALYFAVVCGTAFVQQYWTFALFRFLAGCLGMIVNFSCWTAILETIPDEHRPFISAASGIWWGLVVALMTPIAYGLRTHSWRTLQLVLSASGLHFLFAIFIMEESLRWLIVTDRKASALKLLKKACNMNRVPIESIFSSNTVPDTEMDDINNKYTEISPRGIESMEGKSNLLSSIDTNPRQSKAWNDSSEGYFVRNIETENKTNDKMITMLKDKKLLRESAIIWFAWFVNVLVYYGLYLTSSVMSSDRYIQFFLGSLVEIPATAFSWYIMFRYGRRFGCILGHVIAGVALLCSTVLSSSEDVADSVPALITVLVVIGKFGISLSFGCLYMLTPEFFPTSLRYQMHPKFTQQVDMTSFIGSGIHQGSFRNSGMGIASFFGRAAGAITPYSDNVAKLASWLPGAIFAVTSLTIAWLLKYLPETKGRELPQTIADMQKRQNSSKFTKIHNRSVTLVQAI